MDTTSPIRFSAACGAQTSMDLLIEKDTGEVVTRGTVDQPCALIGRDSYCEIILTDPQVATRHAFLQIIGGVPFVMDLDSKTGIHFLDERKPDGWMSPDVPLSVGPFRIHLTATTSERPTTFPQGFHPLHATTELPAGYQRVAIEFRNGKVTQNVWEVNRVLTLVGRSRSCKINLNSEEVSLFHCYYLNTPDGLWLVDLYGRGGITVNDEPIRYCRLNTGDEIRVSKFVMGVKYLEAAKETKKAPTVVVPTLTVAVPDVPTSRPDELQNLIRENATAVVDLVPVKAVDNSANAAMVQQFATMQNQMMEQFQQSMLSMMKMFGQAQKQQMDEMKEEMDRLTKLTEEMKTIQANMSTGGKPARPALPPSNHLPAPEDVPAISTQSAEQHFNVFERIEQINNERQSIWQKLLKMTGPKAGA